jgi:hypothetical protein
MAGPIGLSGRASTQLVPASIPHRSRSILNGVEFMSQKRVFAVVPGECPRCKSYSIKRVARRGIIEKMIFPVLGLWPYRCQGCDLKYFDYVRYAMLRSERHSESGEAEPS